MRALVAAAALLAVLPGGSARAAEENTNSLLVSYGVAEQYDALDGNSLSYLGLAFGATKHLELQITTLSPSSSDAAVYDLSPEHFHYSASFHQEAFPQSHVRPMANVGLGAGENFFTSIGSPRSFGIFLNIDLGIQVFYERFRLRVSHKSESFIFRSRASESANGMFQFALGYSL